MPALEDAEGGPDGVADPGPCGWLPAKLPVEGGADGVEDGGPCGWPANEPLLGGADAVTEVPETGP